MTRRGRLAKLEARARKVDALDAGGLFDADPLAGVWREFGGRGRVFPLSPDDLDVNGETFTRAALSVGPGGAKIYAGLSWGDV